MNLSNKYYSINDALKKVQEYCAYQERCHKEVRNKLFELGLVANEIDDIIVKLIEENFLSEERFATQFARGKFRMKNWGRVKISFELRQKNITDVLIKKALKEIDEDVYMTVLLRLYTSHIEKQKGALQIKKLKTFKYLQQKGYEASCINEVAKSFNPKKL